jgi:hypothetical protein
MKKIILMVAIFSLVLVIFIYLKGISDDKRIIIKYNDSLKSGEFTNSVNLLASKENRKIIEKHENIKYTDTLELLKKAAVLSNVYEKEDYLKYIEKFSVEANLYKENTVVYNRLILLYKDSLNKVFKSNKMTGLMELDDRKEINLEVIDEEQFQKYLVWEEIWEGLKLLKKGEIKEAFRQVVGSEDPLGQAAWYTIDAMYSEKMNDIESIGYSLSQIPSDINMPLELKEIVEPMMKKYRRDISKIKSIEAASANPSEPEIGMTEDEVINILGEPKKRNITETASSTSEQWVYYSNYVYFENGIVTAIQTSR